jgi:hypothetical protein
MPEDIRDKPFISHQDVIGLNFIRNPCPWIFQRHFRQGLRSHIMEILKPADVALQRSGRVVDGVRWFPKARPHKVFRIFRTRLETLEKALEEIARVKILEQYLAPAHLGKSCEFVVDYGSPAGRDLMLCGFQDYVEGAILDPWGILESDDLFAVMHHNLCAARLHGPAMKNQWIHLARQKAAHFIHRIKKMIAEKAHVPDLAGVGNLVMVSSGDIKLVDMNNISSVVLGSAIALDDRGYPVCDKSIEALALLEKSLLGRPIGANDPLYRHFLDPGRREAVRAREALFRMHDQQQAAAEKDQVGHPAGHGGR